MSNGRVASALTALLMACNGGAPQDAGADAFVDTGSNRVDAATADDVVGVVSCSVVQHICESAGVAYGICCNDCPSGFTCGFANPGLDGGSATAISMCSVTCQNAANCPSDGGVLSQCVRGICYQGCDSDHPCTQGESCVSLYGHSFCTAIACE